MPTAAGARSANETAPHGEASALNPDPEKPATCTRPGSREGHELTGSGRPRPTDHESPITTTRSPEPVTCSARAIEAASNSAHRDVSAPLARFAATYVVTATVSARVSAATTARRRRATPRENTPQVCGAQTRLAPWLKWVVLG